MGQFLTVENGNTKLVDMPTGGGLSTYSFFRLPFWLPEYLEKGITYTSEPVIYPTGIQGKMIEGFLCARITPEDFANYRFSGFINTYIEPIGKIDFKLSLDTFKAGSAEGNRDFRTVLTKPFCFKVENINIGQPAQFFLENLNRENTWINETDTLDFEFYLVYRDLSENLIY